VLSAQEARDLRPSFRAPALAVGESAGADRDEIDCLNILEATLLAMRRAFARAVPVSDARAGRGNRCPCIADLPLSCTLGPSWPGERAWRPVSADFDPAKVYRDRMMEALDA